MTLLVSAASSPVGLKLAFSFGSVCTTAPSAAPSSPPRYAASCEGSALRGCGAGDVGESRARFLRGGDRDRDVERFLDERRRRGDLSLCLGRGEGDRLIEDFCCFRSLRSLYGLREREVSRLL